MENYTLHRDIHLLTVQATSFPQGVKTAFEKLLQTDPSFRTRATYGISHGSKNGIVYWAAVEEADTMEAQKHNLGSYTIRTGTYAMEHVEHYMENQSAIQQAFDRLLKHPNLDRAGECIEYYLNDEVVRCMVRLTD